MRTLKNIIIGAVSLASLGFGGASLGQGIPKNDFTQGVYCQDIDQDGDGDASKKVSAEIRPEGYSPSCSDCDDLNPRLHSDSANIVNQISQVNEICSNGIDDNCNNKADEIYCRCENLSIETYCAGICCAQPEICLEDICCEPKIFYKDSDNDGLGNPKVTSEKVCSPPKGFVDNKDDCSDKDNKLGKIKRCDYNGRYFGEFMLCVQKCPTTPTDENGDISEDNGNFVYSRRTKIMEPETDKLKEVSEDRTRIVFDGTSTFAQDLAKGDYIVSGEYDDSGNVLMVKVVSKEIADGNIVVRTEQASLDEVIKKLAISGKIGLERPSISDLEGSITVEISLVKDLGEEENTFHDLSSRSVLAIHTDNLQPDTNADIHIDGRLETSTETEFVMRIERSHTKYKRVGLYSKEKLELRIYGEFMKKAEGKKVSDAIRFKSKDYEKGKFPLRITPTAYIELGIAAEAEEKAAFDSRVDLVLKRKKGVEYSEEKGKIPEESYDVRREGDSYKPIISTKGNANITAYATVKLVLEFNGSPEMSTTTRGYLNLTTKAEDQEKIRQMCKLYGGFDVSGDESKQFMQDSYTSNTGIVLFSGLIEYDPNVCFPDWYKTCQDTDNDHIFDAVFSKDSCGKNGHIMQQCGAYEYCDKAECKNKLMIFSAKFFEEMEKQSDKINAEMMKKWR